MPDKDILRVASPPKPKEFPFWQHYYKPTSEQIALSARLLLMELEPKSKEEKEARAALAHVVMHHINDAIGVLLASAINPEPVYAKASGCCRIEFKNVRRGNTPNLLRDLAVISFIEQQGGKIHAAKRLAQDNFGLPEETVKTIWKRRKATKERL